MTLEIFLESDIEEEENIIWIDSVYSFERIDECHLKVNDMELRFEQPIKRIETEDEPSILDKSLFEKIFC